MNCAICECDRGYTWTDTHGIAQCIECGAPYRLYHYEGEGDAARRVEKPPELCVRTEYVPVLRAYWNEHHRRMPGGFSFPGGYEVATRDDLEVFNCWMNANADRILAGAGPASAAQEEA